MSAELVGELPDGPKAAPTHTIVHGIKTAFSKGEGVAGLMRSKLVAGHVFMGRDEELAELVGDGSSGGPTAGGDSLVAHIKGAFASQDGVGRETVDAIFAKRGIESRVKFIREACATLKASGEHDKIVARVSAECRAAREPRSYRRRVRAASRKGRTGRSLRYPVTINPYTSYL